jgi:hypothetical protein
MPSEKNIMIIVVVVIVLYMISQNSPYRTFGGSETAYYESQSMPPAQMPPAQMPPMMPPNQAMPMNAAYRRRAARRMNYDMQQNVSQVPSAYTGPAPADSMRQNGDVKTVTNSYYINGKDINNERMLYSKKAHMKRITGYSGSGYALSGKAI